MSTPRRDLILIGASSGGFTALTAVVRDLPRSLSAAVVILLHRSEKAPNLLVDILGSLGGLPVKEAAEGTPIEPGHIYLPPADGHLLVDAGHFRISHGPRENFVRPAIDPLFRSAARSYGPRVIGVILSGSLDDGTAGLLAIKRRGGLAIVQDPSTAAFPSMPASALEFVTADYVLPPNEIAGRLVDLAGSPAGDGNGNGGRARGGDPEVGVQLRQGEDPDMDVVNALGKPSTFSCPDCNGVLWEIHDGDLIRFRCRAGHAYGPQSLQAGKGEAVEIAVWTAIRALKEKMELGRRIADRVRNSGPGVEAERADERLRFMEQQVVTLRELLDQL